MHPELEKAASNAGVIVVDLGPIDAFDESSDWSARRISTTDLAAWLVQHSAARHILLRGIEIVPDAVAPDPHAVDLAHVRLSASMVLRDSLVGSVLVLDHAAVRRLEFDRCDLRCGARFESVRVDSGLVFSRGTRLGAVEGVSLAVDSGVLGGSLEIAGDGTRFLGGLMLGGASIGGQISVTGGAQVAADTQGRAVNADGLKVGQDLVVDGADTRLEGGLRLVGAAIGGQLAVTGGAQIGADTHGRALNADGLEVGQGLVVDGADTRLEGGLRLVGAAIGGQLAVTGGAQIGVDTDARALNADGLRVGQGLYVDGKKTRLEGALRLTGATISGQLAVSGGARIAPDTTGWALNADRLHVGQSLFVDGKDTILEGGLRLVGATIGGQLAVRNGAHVAADSDGRAVNADGLRVGQDLFVDGTGTTLDGGLQLVGAAIGGQLAFSGGAQTAADAQGRSINAHGLTVGQDLYVTDERTRLGGGLRLVRATVGGELSVRREAHVQGALDLQGGDVANLVVETGDVDGTAQLTSARLGRLQDSPTGWHRVGGHRLTGVTIEALSGTLHGDRDWTVEQRIEWLRADSERSRRPYAQVATLYREAGLTEQARKIVMAGERTTSSRWRRLWAGTTIGYGYQPWRAGVIALVLVLVGWLVIWGLGGDELFTPTSTQPGTACPQDYPCLNRAVYLTETVVPVVGFGQRDAWRLDTTQPYGATLEIGQHLLDALGWILGLMLLAAATGAIRRD
jgi:hypothetical protein